MRQLGRWQRVVCVLLSILIIAGSCAGFTPITAMADVNGQDTNDYNAPVDIADTTLSEKNNYTAYGNKGGTAVYDPTTGVLTLTNYNMDYNPGYESPLIATSGALTVNLVGTNTITGDCAGMGAVMGIKITGSGTLNIDVTYRCLLNFWNELEIRDTTVNLTGSVPFYAVQMGIYGSTVVAKGSVNSISCNTDVVISDHSNVTLYPGVTGRDIKFRLVPKDGKSISYTYGSSESSTTTELYSGETEISGTDPRLQARYIHVWDEGGWRPRIDAVAITGVATPTVGKTLTTWGTCETDGVTTTSPAITWKDEDGNRVYAAAYNKTYTAYMTLRAEDGRRFTENVTATVSGNAADVTHNTDGSITVSYTYPATSKDRLKSYAPPADITVGSGTPWNDIVGYLPDAVNIETEGGTVDLAEVRFRPEEASPAYDPNTREAQTITIQGTVQCPEGVDPGTVDLETSITIHVLAAGYTGNPIADPPRGQYSENQLVTLTCSTEGAQIYYTTDGSTPTRESTLYTGPIAVTGTKGQTVQTTIRAFAVSEHLQDSLQVSYSYWISIPKDPDIRIPSVELTATAPIAGSRLSPWGGCSTEGVKTTSPSVIWYNAAGKVVYGKADYNTIYSVHMTVWPQEGYIFTNGTTATVGGETADRVTLNQNGSITVTYTYPATAMDKLLSYTKPADITVANGTPWKDIIGYLPDAVAIKTEGQSENATWVYYDPDSATPTYDPNNKNEQKITIPATVVCPPNIDPNGVNLQTSITVTVSDAGTVGAPIANKISTTYEQDMSVEFESSTEGAQIYYTLDESTPTANSTLYDGPIQLTGKKGQTITYIVKAIAMKDGLAESGVMIYIYRISIPDDPEPPTPGPDPEDPGQNRTSAGAAASCAHHYVWQTYRAATATTDGILRYACEYCGDVEYEVPTAAYYVFNKETQEAIQNAEPGATVRVSTPIFVSFHEMVRDALVQRSDVTLEVSYVYQGMNYVMVIPADSGETLTTLFGNDEYAGFVYLGGVFQTTEM